VVVEEVQHHWSVQIGQLEGGGWLAGALFGEAEQQLERVAVAFHGAGTRATLGDQAPEKEVLHQLREADLRGPHERPSGALWAKASKRAATMPINSGTAERYQ